jgi:hypothetical protein
MLSVRDRNRMRAAARLAGPGPAVVVTGRRDGDAFEVASTLTAAGRTPVLLVGPFDPLALHAALGRPELRGRVRAAVGAPVALSARRLPAAALVCLDAEGLPPAALRAFGSGWARHVRAGGYLALWGGAAPSLTALGVTPAHWDAWPAGRCPELARRKPVG